MNSYHLKVVTSEEVAALRGIAIQTFREAFEVENAKKAFEKYLNDKMSLDHLQSELDNRYSTFYFLQKGEEIVGYLKVNIEDAQTEKKLKNALEVERIYLLTKYRGKGVGNLLMDKAVALAKEMGKDKLWLGVWEDNPSSIKFYQKFGFKIFDKHTFMLGDEEQLDFLMKLEL